MGITFLYGTSSIGFEVMPVEESIQPVPAPDVIRAIAQELSNLKRHDFDELCERTVLESILLCHPSHEFSEKEYGRLLELRSFTEVFTWYENRTVEKLIREAYFARSYLDHFSRGKDINWIVGLYECGATSLLRRELDRLVEICRELHILP
jgi:hypothetical protein